MNYLKKIKAYMSRYGILKLYRKAYEKFMDKDRKKYNQERLTMLAGSYELAAQSNRVFKNNVKISILVPLFNTESTALRETLLSVKAQSYENWELCLVDAGNEKKKKIIDEVFPEDSRIKYKDLRKNLGISGNSNEALKLATGEYTAFLDHDDLLEPDALYYIMEYIEKGYEFIYTDEDKVNAGLDNYFAPYRKTDFNLNLLLSNNYICHFTAIKRSIVESIGGFRSAYDGAQDYDLFLRCIEKTKKIGHIDRILYHWRVGDNSTSDNPFNKEYAFDAGKRALADYLKRNGYKNTYVKELDDPGYYRIVCTNKGGLKVSVVMDGNIISEEADYYLLLEEDMHICNNDIEKLIKMAYFTKADIIVPKIVRKGKYYYNGIAKAGKNHTPSLKGKKHWFRGKFNLAITNMDIHAAPSIGILIRRELYEKKMFINPFHINSLRGKYNGLKMVYAPEAVIIKKR